MKRLFLLDNQDSFTYNLAHYFEALGAEVAVSRYNDSVLTKCAEADAIVLSPGPGLPSEQHGLKTVITEFRNKKPILGVCLGLQALLEYDGGRLSNLPQVKHGVTEEAIITENNPLFNGMNKSVGVGLYHSWAVREKDKPASWVSLAIWNGWIMAAKHQELPLYGVQFHPESVLTPRGKEMLFNWLQTL